jgi:hypothetical protein
VYWKRLLSYCYCFMKDGLWQDSMPLLLLLHETCIHKNLCTPLICTTNDDQKVRDRFFLHSLKLYHDNSHCGNFTTRFLENLSDIVLVGKVLATNEWFAYYRSTLKFTSLVQDDCFSLKWFVTKVKVITQVLIHCKALKVRLQWHKFQFFYSSEWKIIRLMYKLLCNNRRERCQRKDEATKLC